MVFLTVSGARKCVQMHLTDSVHRCRRCVVVVYQIAFAHSHTKEWVVISRFSFDNFVFDRTQLLRAMAVVFDLA